MSYFLLHDQPSRHYGSLSQHEMVRSLQQAEVKHSLACSCCVWKTLLPVASGASLRVIQLSFTLHIVHAFATCLG